MTSTARYAPRQDRPGFLAAPFVLAARVFRPSRPDRITDAAIEAAALARTVIGIGATVWMIYTYPMKESFSSFAKDQFTQTLISAGVLIVAVPLILTVFVAATRPPVRREYLCRLSSPMAGFAALFTSVLVLFLLLQNSGGARLAPAFGPFQIVFLLLALAAVLFAVPFALTAAVLCVHYVFRTADVHEVLPPLISSLLVWALFGFQLFDSSPVAAPQAIQLLFLFGPALSVTALSWWELRRLRTHFDVTLRGALHRGRRPRQW
ncbi:hypothetical protein [Streptomyces sp. NBC_01601]|uniref:hypothetical protein n=1 Tax=Streptomyces sp. NBC_01601 TaxID=2975892 RepID=UPI002E2AF38D|nr:hypothetical protein [Streptomyces sp. NBC_01601]